MNLAKVLRVCVLRKNRIRRNYELKEFELSGADYNVPLSHICLPNSADSVMDRVKNMPNVLKSMG